VFLIILMILEYTLADLKACGLGHMAKSYPRDGSSQIVGIWNGT